MNHKETIEHYATLKAQRLKAESVFDEFSRKLADGIIPFIDRKDITEKLGSDLMISIIKAFLK